MDLSKSNMNSRVHRALLNNDLKKLIGFLHRGANVNALIRTNSPYPGGPELRSVLMLAVKESEIALVQVLIEKGADVRMQVQGRTALAEAVQRGDAGILRMLLEHGADVNDRGDNGTSYLQVVDMVVNTYQMATYDPEMDGILRKYGAKLESVLSEEQIREAIDALQKGYVVHCDICQTRLAGEHKDQQWHIFCSEGCTDAYWLGEKEI